jgi:hypothetical protein
VTKQILLGVTTTNIYTLPQSNGGTILNRVNIKTKVEDCLAVILAYQALT